MGSSVYTKLSSKIVSTAVDQLVDRFAVSPDLCLYNRVLFTCTSVDHEFIRELAFKFFWQENCVHWAIRILIIFRIRQLQHIVITPSVERAFLCYCKRVVVATDNFSHLLWNRHWNG